MSHFTQLESLILVLNRCVTQCLATDNCFELTSSQESYYDQISDLNLLVEKADGLHRGHRRVDAAAAPHPGRLGQVHPGLWRALSG